MIGPTLVSMAWNTDGIGPKRGIWHGTLIILMGCVLQEGHDMWH